MTAHIVVRSLGDVPATMSRELLHDLLRIELGFDGLVVTDALEMKAISETVGVEEGAVRASPRAPTRSASATTSSTSPSCRCATRSSMRSARSASRRSVSCPPLPGCRASSSSHRRAPRTWPSTARPADSPRVERLLVEGDARLDGPVLVVELEPEVGMAAGRLSQLPGEWFQAAVPEAEALRFDADTFDPDLELGARRLVVIARDAHRHDWEREAVEALTARADDVT